MLLPVNVAPTGPLAMPTVTVSVLSLVTTLPNWSSILTVTAGAMCMPAVVVVGCWPNTSWLAVAGVTVKLLEAGPLRLLLAVSLSVYVPVVFRRKLLNEATPLLAVTVVVLLPEKLPGPPATPTVTVSVLSVEIRLPNWSSIWTVTAGAMADPAVVLLGCWPKTSLLAVDGVTLKLLEAGPVRPPVAVSLSV